MPLHLDYRPEKLEDIVGNESIKESLNSIFSRKEDYPHSFLFHGPAGCGKTTLARIIAKIVHCSPEDIYEYNAANTRGIDTIRDIADNSRYSPLIGKVKVYILDEAGKITGDAQNALLKLLEDTPKHVYFILCTTEPEKLIKTIRTRCTTYQVSALSEDELLSLLQKVTEAEQLKEYPEEILKKIVSVSEGCPRIALVLLDSIIDIEDNEKAIEAIEAFTVNEVEVVQICRLLLSKNKNWKQIAALIKDLKAEPESARYAILGYLGAVLLNSGNPQIAEMMTYFQESFYYTKKSGLILSLFLASRN